MQATSDDEKKEPARFRTLTHRTRGGKLYERDTKVEHQVLTALVLTDKELIERAQIQDKQAAEYLQEEALVYLIREHQRSGSTPVVDALCRELLERIKQFIQNQFRSLDEDEAQQAETDVQSDLFGPILDLESDRGDFLQVRFWRALKLMTISAFRQATSHLNERWSPQDSAGSEDEQEEDEKLSSLATQNAITLDEHILLREALEAIEEPSRTAFILHYGEGWQIESNDPADPTISKHFGKTPRTIRNWLRRAEKALEEWRGDGHD